MAVFYKHIKGVGENQTLWTWIKWAAKTKAVQPESIEVSQNMECSPEIWINSTNSDPELEAETATSYNLGHIITSKATEQKIEESFIFNKEVIVQELKHNNYISLYAQNTDLKTSMNVKVSTNDYIIKYKDQNKETSILTLTKLGKLTVPGEVELGDSTQNVTVKNDLSVNHDLIAGNMCQAIYFNATSDKRAKENIHPLLTNALDIIKKVQVYTFNLKSQPEEKMVGVIAQEFLDNKLDGVSLVANETATGKDGDYMSIRESKLVYLLLKGIQEQQEQIEQLQKRITELESK